MSSINPNIIDGTYPTAGQDNSSQGMRDNFTNIKNNLAFAKNEIEDLQSKVVLKSALDGTNLDNNGGGSLLRSFELRNMSYTRVAKGTAAGTVTLNYGEGNYQTVTTSGSITLGFTGFPSAGKIGSLKLEIEISNVAHTLTLPSAVSIGDATLAGFSATPRTITFETTGTYLYEFTTDDSGTTISVNDLTQNRTKLSVRTPVNTGQAGDHAGLVVVDGSYLYVCTGDYDGNTEIWKRVELDAY